VAVREKRAADCLLDLRLPMLFFPADRLREGLVCTDFNNKSINKQRRIRKRGMLSVLRHGYPKSPVGWGA
jgi:hypothetical protein